MPKLSNNEKSPFTDIIRLSALDLSANATAITAGTYRIATIPLGGFVELATLARPTAFNAEVTAATASVGITSGTATSLIAATDIGATTSAIAPLSNSGGAYTANSGIAGTTRAVNASTTAGGDGVFLKIAFTGGQPTAGDVVIGLRIIDTAQYLS
jgi:hypothetical protein